MYKYIHKDENSIVIVHTASKVAIFIDGAGAGDGVGGVGVGVLFCFLGVFTLSTTLHTECKIRHRV